MLHWYHARRKDAGADDDAYAVVFEQRQLLFSQYCQWQMLLLLRGGSVIVVLNDASEDCHLQSYSVGSYKEKLF
jgi:hypothetical protein